MRSSEASCRAARACALLTVVLSFSCRGGDDVHVSPARPELVEIDLDGNGYQLSFLLPDAAWRRVQPEGPPRGFLYVLDGRTLHVTIHLKVGRFKDAEDEALATDAVVRAFEPGTGWPYVGVVVAYRGPPDEAMLETFKKSFRIERR